MWRECGTWKSQQDCSFSPTCLSLSLLDCGPFCQHKFGGAATWLNTFLNLDTGLSRSVRQETVLTRSAPMSKGKGPLPVHLQYGCLCVQACVCVCVCVCVHMCACGVCVCTSVCVGTHVWLYISTSKMCISFLNVELITHLFSEL